ncbi:helix-turn-helix domain-containing protein [Streptomyces europaeiscabiei]|uniref:Helix-turn-helix domain-containing protein n=1 Tax=Streptomyces europaeiscabiei TaxID=146819 RepID=A0ABU4NG02_9ACTN|nr:helix-turn-helix domain-containing protein [Streptomyces europaeiscabiei]MDX2762946.1 helix-turn-helix domain-containing protein [Streptomyces europaeiscabiei]MDX3544587.1 helix-turn-helix domain-containing protein [Streptomyces europaeiscabiei]MDX3553937.1 helix-turn-helix domain-containing protein [Streptomyces europaeiscabiei]MDX3702055.1 helix-turn-helix domain-containing protein [Streptomyces europaeiscabiei]
MPNNKTTVPVDLLDSPDVMYKGGAFIRTPKALLYSFDLTHQAKLLWQILEEHAGQNRKSNAGQKRLAALMNIGLSQLKVYVKELRDQGWLITHGNNGDTLSYTLAIPAGFRALDEDSYKHGTTQVEVTVKDAIMEKDRKAWCGIEAKGTDMAPRLAISANRMKLEMDRRKIGVAGIPARGVAEKPARGSRNPDQEVAGMSATNNKKEQEEVTIRIKQPLPLA